MLKIFTSYLNTIEKIKKTKYRVGKFVQVWFFHSCIWNHPYQEILNLSKNVIVITFQKHFDHHEFKFESGSLCPSLGTR